MRVWLKTNLDSIPLVQALVGDRVYQGEAMRTAVVPKPFIFFTIGVSSSEQFSEDEFSPRRQFFQVYVHDEGTDYTNIDDLVNAIIAHLRNLGGPEYGIITTTYLETSTDLDDMTLATIYRYIRFQSILEA